jgi:hypothetical protein
MNRDDSNGVKRDVMLLFEDGIGVNWYKVPGWSEGVWSLVEKLCGRQGLSLWGGEEGGWLLEGGTGYLIIYRHIGKVEGGSQFLDLEVTLAENLVDDFFLSKTLWRLHREAQLGRTWRGTKEDLEVVVLFGGPDSRIGFGGVEMFTMSWPPSLGGGR